MKPKKEYCGSHEPTMIQVGKGIIIAGAGAKLRGVEDVDLEIDLNPGLNTSCARYRLFGGAEDLIPSAIKLAQPVPALRIDWPDQGVLDVPDEVFTDIRKLLKKGKTVSVFCMAGHGRTGTFLCRLLSMGETSLKWLRKNYCEEAVESQVQIAHLLSKGLCQTDDKPSNNAGGVGGVGLNRHYPPASLNDAEWIMFSMSGAHGRKQCELEKGPCTYHRTGGGREQHCGGDKNTTKGLV